MDRTVYIDLRCMQDPDYRVRGIGQHLAALLRTRARSTFSTWKAVGLTDPRWPRLPFDCSACVDEVTSCLNPTIHNQPSVFINETPMTHDPRFNLRFVGHPSFLSAAVVHDFIPFDWPGYLPTVRSRMDYVAKMAWLRNFDFYLPVSEYTASRLNELLGVSRARMAITGSAVRRSLYEFSDRRSSSRLGGAAPYFVILVAPDVRKNPEVVVKAIRRLNLFYSRGITLKVAGHYDRDYKARLLQLAGHAEGSGFVEFYPDIPDADLMDLYAGAAGTVISSHIEGFSLPVVEATLCGCPVIASTCAAHLELIQHPAALFPSDDASTLAEKLQALLTDPGLRTSIIESQSHLGAKFHENAVGERFWNGIESAIEKRREHRKAATRIKPRITFLTPYPPEEHDAAIYTAMIRREGSKWFNTDLYIDTNRPFLSKESTYATSKVSLAPLVATNSDSIVSVLDNSSSGAVVEFVDRYGGPCILHDVCLAQSYYRRLGREGFQSFASRLLHRSVPSHEVDTWFQKPETSPLFLERILERAVPLMVQTEVQKQLLKSQYGVDAHVLTSCVSMFFGPEETAPVARLAARQRLGLPGSSFVLFNFGNADSVKERDTCIMALDFLRDWNIPAELYLVSNSGALARERDEVAEVYGVTKHVHETTHSYDSPEYRDFLLAADAAVQLREYRFGTPSIALSNCISAGLPCVATSDMVRASDAPAYVSPVPDQFSPLHVAEQLAALWEGRRDPTGYEEERRAYVSAHNFGVYTARLLEILGIA